ncbi:carbohydrate ABC transporter permease [Agromyces rhizosphaerae]|uniref:carbohydrate ABC transporter permease n=1 Tax=Agromyces rhizosphaerae TaxID=88374 RepID=UPI0024900468|nr:sugar ABC transporter permease [Agromyces rhizosphaerae]
MSRRSAIAFAAPAVIFLLVFFIYPIVRTVQMSLTDFTGVGDATFIGGENYERIFTRTDYLEALWITIRFTFVVVVVQTLAGLVMAALLYRLPAIRNFSRAALFTPAMMSFVVVGYVWQFIYSPFSGGLNALLRSVGLDFLAQGWLGNPDIALYAIAIAHVWMFTGYTTAIFLAGYAAISPEIDEAARIDGASSWQRFRFMELPLLSRSFTINIILSTIGTLKTFELPFIMTRGGPDGATQTLSLEIIYQLFRNFDFGFASALSAVMLVVIVVIAMLQNWYLRKREDAV